LLSRIVVLLAVAASVAASTASASGAIKKGIFDEANTLYGDPPKTFPILEELGTKYVRMNLHWGGRFGVSGVDPTVRPTDPNDGQYDWGIYDRAVQYAAENGIQVVFSIVDSPPWANGRRLPRYAPTTTLYINHLRDFAYAAALRYSGTYRRPSDGIVLPPVRYWLAWNEPNNPIWLQPQVRSGRFVSPQIYARVCNAIVTGIKSTFLRGERVACGVTAPRGNNSPRAARPSVSPLAFLRGMKRYGAKGFDAYAHHPYYGKRTETPATKPPARTAVTLGNIGDLDKELRRLYGAKRIWITEYGYQTRPERLYGVTNAQQAMYMRQAWTIAKRHPRIDMFLWFMLKDDTNIPVGWQSGLMTAGWAPKPSFNVFRSLR
jgi:Glycosyl hydrolase catalytic core